MDNQSKLTESQVDAIARLLLSLPPTQASTNSTRQADTASTSATCLKGNE
jgi:hypothetical protein